MHCYLTHACLTMFYIHLYTNIQLLMRMWSTWVNILKGCYS